MRRMDCERIMKYLFKSLLLVLLSSHIIPVFASSAWIGEPGSLNMSVLYLHETYDEFFRADQDAKLPDDIEQNSLVFLLEYALTDSLALDLKTGVTETQFAPATRGDFSGRDDSRIGLRWRFVDEYLNDKNLPTMTLNAVAIIAGDYEQSSPGNPHSPGDGASGAAISLLVGKIFNNGFILSSELGYRDRSSPVPSDVFFRVGGYYWLSNQFMLNLAYDNEAARSGVNIGDPGITPSEFDQLHEDQEIVSFGFLYQATPKHGFGFDVARTIDGRNTGKKDIFVFRYQISL